MRPGRAAVELQGRRHTRQRPRHTGRRLLIVNTSKPSRCQASAAAGSPRWPASKPSSIKTIDRYGGWPAPACCCCRAEANSHRRCSSAGSSLPSRRAANARPMVANTSRVRCPCSAASRRGEKPLCPRPPDRVRHLLIRAQRLRRLVRPALPLPDRQAGAPRLRSRSQCGRGIAGHRQRRVEGQARLGEPAAHKPVPHQRNGQPQRGLGRTVAPEGIERNPQIRRLGIQPAQPLPLPRPAQLRLGPLGQRQIVVGVPAPYRYLLPCFAQPVQAVRGDRLQQPEPIAINAHGQRAVHQSCQQVQHVVGGDSLRGAHRLRRIHCAPTGVDGKPPQHGLLGAGQQLPAPVDHRAQRALPDRRVPRPRAQQPEPVPGTFSRAASSGTPSAGARVAASSSASGMPSRRRHTSATPAVVSGSAVSPALVRNSRTAEERASRDGSSVSGISSGGRSQRASPRRRSGSRLVASTRRPGAAGSSVPTSGPAGQRAVPAPSDPGS